MSDKKKIIEKAIEIQTQVEVLEKQKKCLEEEIIKLLNTPLNEE